MEHLTHRWDVISVFAFVGVWLLLYLLRRAPSAAEFRDFVETLAGRGGNILILTGLSVWFAAMAVRLIYASIWMVASGKLDEKSAVLMMALQWVMGSAFGGAFGALLKTLDGQTHGTAPLTSTPPPPPVPSAPAGSAAAAPPLQATAAGAPRGPRPAGEPQN